MDILHKTKKNKSKAINSKVEDTQLWTTVLILNKIKMP